MLILALALQVISPGSVFTCDQSSLEQALPRLKIVMLDGDYKKLSALHDKLIKENVENSAVGKMGNVLLEC